MPEIVTAGRAGATVTPIRGGFSFTQHNVFQITGELTPRSKMALRAISSAAADEAAEKLRQELARGGPMRQLVKGIR